MSPQIQDPTSNHTPTPVPSFSSVFFPPHLLPPQDLNTCCPHALGVGTLYLSGMCHLYREDNLRLHHLAAPPLFSVALHTFSPQLLSQCRSMPLLAYFIIICHFPPLWELHENRGHVISTYHCSLGTGSNAWHIDPPGIVIK